MYIQCQKLFVYSVSGAYWVYIQCQETTGCVFYTPLGGRPVVRLIADYDTSGQRDATVLYLYHYWVEVDLS